MRSAVRVNCSTTTVSRPRRTTYPPLSCAAAGAASASAASAASVFIDRNLLYGGADDFLRRRSKVPAHGPARQGRGPAVAPVCRSRVRSGRFRGGWMAYGVIQFVEAGKRIATLVRTDGGEPTGE